MQNVSKKKKSLRKEYASQEGLVYVAIWVGLVQAGCPRQSDLIKKTGNNTFKLLFKAEYTCIQPAGQPETERHSKLTVINKI